MAITIPPTSLDIELIPGSVKGAIKVAGATGTEMYMVPLAALSPIEGFNVRVTGIKAYDAGIDALAASMQTEGFYRDKPLSGFVGKAADGTDTIFLTDGHRRLEAVHKAIAAGAAIEKVPVIIKAAGTSMEDLTVALTKTGEPLTPYEFALVVKRMLGFGHSTAEVAKRLGITTRWADDLLTLLAGPAKVRNLVMTGKISATEAIKQLRANPETAAETITDAVKSAEAAGKKRASGKDVKKAKVAKSKESGVKEATPGTKAAEQLEGDALKLDYTLEALAGQVMKLSEIAVFAKVGGGTWFSETDREGQVQILQDIKISLKMSRKPKPPGELMNPALAEEAAGL